MAINRATRYPGRFDDPVAGQPEGAFKNKSGDLAVDGSYLEKDWANDWAAFFSSVLNGEAANGTPDTVGACQLFDRLLDLIVPVGTVVFRTGATSPASQYPGTSWQRIAEGRYIVGEGTHTDSAGTSRTLAAGNLIEGTYEHELLEAELPTHTHITGYIQTGVSVGAGGTVLNLIQSSYPNDYGATSSGTGSGDAHNNMPPAVVMYTWERTA